MNKKVLIFLLTSTVVFFVLWNFGGKGRERTPQISQESLFAGREAMMTRVAIEKEGKALVQQGKYDDAIDKYSAALGPEYRKYEWEMGVAKYSIHKILKLQMKYNEALEALTWHLSKNPNKYDLAKKELEALIEFQRTKDPEVVRRYIQLLKETEKVNPPLTPISPSSMSNILRLYNTIGDHDAGINLIDQLIEWAYVNEVNVGPWKGLITTYEEAVICTGDGKPVKQRDANWSGCRWLAYQYHVREAFERDKAEGFEGCAKAVPGEPCIGHATKALIKSDYFPW